jgi:hypothetical protein
VAPHVLSLAVVLAICTVYRVLTQPRRDERRGAGGPVRISRRMRGREDDTRM